MDLFFISFVSLVISLIFTYKLLVHKKLKNLPPGPPSLPIIGHLHLIKSPVHRVFQTFSFEYGPVISLRFGSRPVLVVTSPSAVEECFTNNDVILANRPVLPSGKYLDYNQTTLSAAPYGHLWRDLRRITTLELFSSTKLKAYMRVREDEVKSFVKDLYHVCSDDSVKVEMKSRIQGLSFNIIMRIVANKRFYGTDVEDFEEASKFKDVIRGVFEIGGTSNVGDFIPVLQWIDFQGFDKKFKRLQIKSDNFSQSLIDDVGINVVILVWMKESLRHSSMQCSPLQESEPEYYTDDIIKGNILTLLLAGTDTSAVTIEWAISLLLNHPGVLEKARAQVNEYVGHERMVEETDLPNLPYIQCIINETLRLFPAAPLLVPHEPSQDCTIGGFHVSRGTMVMVNAWAIHRDPMLWDDPLSFKPERFEKVENEGYRFIPFGMGRRQCPGSSLANRIVGLALASLIQCFKWERIGEDLVDLSEGKGLTMPKSEHLEAMCKARQRMRDVLKEL